MNRCPKVPQLVCIGTARSPEGREDEPLGRVDEPLGRVAEPLGLVDEPLAPGRIDGLVGTTGRVEKPLGGVVVRGREAEPPAGGTNPLGNTLLGSSNKRPEESSITSNLCSYVGSRTTVALLIIVASPAALRMRFTVLNL